MRTFEEACFGLGDEGRHTPFGSIDGFSLPGGAVRFRSMCYHCGSVIESVMHLEAGVRFTGWESLAWWTPTYVIKEEMSLGDLLC